MRTTSMAALGLCCALGAATPALAQSTGAPAGRDPATAPGGSAGVAGPRNQRDAVRSGDAVPVAPPVGAAPAETPHGAAPTGQAAPPPRP